MSTGDIEMWHVFQKVWELITEVLELLLQAMASNLSLATVCRQLRPSHLISASSPFITSLFCSAVYMLLPSKRDVPTQHFVEI